jgi:hypothetical protein
MLELPLPASAPGRATPPVSDAAIRTVPSAPNARERIVQVDSNQFKQC